MPKIWQQRHSQKQKLKKLERDHTNQHSLADWLGERAAEKWLEAIGQRRSAVVVRKQTSQLAPKCAQKRKYENKCWRLQATDTHQHMSDDGRSA